MRRKAAAFAVAAPILSMLGAIIAPCWAEMTAVEADIGKTHVGVQGGPLPPEDLNFRLGHLPNNSFKPLLGLAKTNRITNLLRSRS